MDLATINPSNYRGLSLDSDSPAARVRMEW